jgi:hypothetical protein
MWTGWLFTVVDEIFGGIFTWVGTLMSGNLWKIIIFILTFAVVGLIIYYAKKAINSSKS